MKGNADAMTAPTGQQQSGQGQQQAPPGTPPAVFPVQGTGQQPPANNSGQQGQNNGGQQGQNGGGQQQGQNGPHNGEPLGAPGLAALQAERDARAAAERAAREAQAALAARNQQDMTELQRAQAAQATAEQAAATANGQLLRYRVASEHQVHPDDMILLNGADEQTLRAQAQRLIQIRAGTGGATPPPPGGATPPTPGGATPPASPPAHQQTGPPAFAPNPGQHAGNATPPATATVAAGAELYRQRHPRKTTA